MKLNFHPTHCYLYSQVRTRGDDCNSPLFYYYIFLEKIETTSLTRATTDIAVAYIFFIVLEWPTVKNKITAFIIYFTISFKTKISFFMLGEKNSLFLDCETFTYGRIVIKFIFIKLNNHLSWNYLICHIKTKKFKIDLKCNFTVHICF